MSEKNEQDRSAAINDVVADALGSAYEISGGVAIDDKALLTKYGFDDLEPVFAMRDIDGQILKEKEPCYQLQAEGFYGRGLHGTWYQEGAVIVTPDVPNQHMKPLNRAAGVNYAKWLETLPQNKVTIEIGDMSEAAVILSKD